MIDFNILPRNSGCYLFKDKQGKILYIGKAKNIRKRVSSYFQNKELDQKTKTLVGKTDSVDFIVTDTEVEALVLENNLIKKHKPKYNIDLKDSRRYAYILLTDEDFPRLIVARDRIKKGKYFGPLVSVQERDYILQSLKKIFQLRTCKKIPRKACLRYHIELCSAPCMGGIESKEYFERITKIEKILKGKTREIINSMRKEMKNFSDKQDFEKAIEIRNQIEALERLSEHQKMELQRKYDEDIIGYEVKEGRVYLLLFNVYKGTVINKREFVFDFTENFIEEFLIQYYSENKVPREIIVQDELEDSLKKFLEIKRKEKVKITVPKSGLKKELMELVLKNLEISYFGSLRKVEELQEKIDLKEKPEVIECFDISHLSGTSIVGSMVQFRNGIPDKSNYRRFRVKTIHEIDDFRAIAEIVRRRYKKLKEEGKEFPNLIVIDGGRGQLNFAMEELKKLKLKIPIISIAKQFEEIYLPGRENPLVLNRKGTALKFVQEIRDEAHRFAISYQRLLRKKSQ